MAEQYRKDYEHEGRREGGGSRGDYERGEDRPHRGGDWRGGQTGRSGEPDDRGYAMSERGGITRETGWDRGWRGRDERDSRDWQQRIDSDRQGYRTRERQSDREWQGEPDWQSDRPRGWQGGRDWSTERSEWRGRGSDGRTDWGRGDDRAQAWYRSGERDRQDERFATGGPHASEQDWAARSGARGRERDWLGAGSGRGRSGPWNEGFGGETWQGRDEWQGQSGERWERERRSGREDEHLREERGREGGRGPGGGWPWGGGGGPMSTWGIGGSESPRGIGGTREGAWPGYAGRGPKGYRRSDERIREEVSDRLTDDPRVDASELSVEVKDGVVTLTGTVPDREQKRRAEEVAEQAPGVSDVTNNLRAHRQPSGGAWQPMGQQGAQQVGQQVPIGGQQSVEGMRAGQAGMQGRQQQGQQTGSRQEGQPQQAGGQGDTARQQTGRQATQAGQPGTGSGRSTKPTTTTE